MTTHVLLDLGNVVIGVDFRQVFRAWATSADVSEEIFFERWRIDSAYEALETGKIDFASYTEHLAQTLEIDMPLDAWRDGWNAIFTQPYDDVIDRLPAVKARYRLFAFTNTNDTHTLYWQEHFPAGVAAFEEVFISSHIGHRKPYVQSYHHVCDAMGVTPDAVVFLDDNQDNIDGARAAGLQAIHTPRQQDVVEQLDKLLAARPNP